MTDRIEKTIEIGAPVSRVWRALTDYREFGAWFRVALATPFAVGHTVIGKMQIADYDHTFSATVRKMEPERLFSFTWHPFPVDKARDYSKEPETLVEFTLRKTETGTLLRVVESGFAGIPAERRAEAFGMHEKGWSAQLNNIARHVASALEGIPAG